MSHSNCKKRNNGPSRNRYWSEKRLYNRKIKNLMVSNGLSKDDAVKTLAGTRVTQMKFKGAKYSA